jgi:hypothetical protein
MIFLKIFLFAAFTCSASTSDVGRAWVFTRSVEVDKPFLVSLQPLQSNVVYSWELHVDSPVAIKRGTLGTTEIFIEFSLAAIGDFVPRITFSRNGSHIQQISLPEIRSTPSKPDELRSFAATFVGMAISLISLLFKALLDSHLARRRVRNLLLNSVLNLKEYLGGAAPSWELPSGLNEVEMRPNEHRIFRELKRLKAIDTAGVRLKDEAKAECLATIEKWLEAIS